MPLWIVFATYLSGVREWIEFLEIALFHMVCLSEMHSIAEKTIAKVQQIQERFGET
jgi:hypothetical protein